MQTQKQKEADERYRLRHPERLKAKDQKRYLEHREEELARNKRYWPSYYAENAVAIRAGYRNRRHGITQEWFDAKVLEQGGCCALCGKLFDKTPHLDHDHRCCPPLKSCEKCRRDLLCEDCNLGLGRFKDDDRIQHTES